MSKIKATKRAPSDHLPTYGHMHMGRDCDRHRDLTWRRVCKEAEKGGIVLTLAVVTAPDAHTPYTYEYRDDPRDVRGALRTARAAVESGRAQYASVTARAERYYFRSAEDGGRACWDLGGFEVANEEGVS